MKDTNTIRFFKELSQRMYKENDLSDIVYALCESNLQFKQFFLDFFFKDELIAANATIEREVQYEDGSRPDFVIRHLKDNKEEVFFVENKIWDRSHHFAQYAKTLRSRKNIGYITNYELKEQDLGKDDKAVFIEIQKDCRIKRWGQFREELAKKAEDVNEQSWATSEDIQGFLAYCEEICPDNQETVEKFDLKVGEFCKVQYFYECLEKSLDRSLIKVANKEIKIEPYNYGGFNKPSEWIGRYFGAEGLLNQKVWGWIGFYLNKGKKTPQGLCIEFLNKPGWGKPIFDQMQERGYQIDYCFDVSSWGNKKEAEIVRFMQECLQNTFEKVLDRRRPDQANEKYILECIRDMRRLPLFLQQQVLTGLQVKNANIEITSGSDSSKPNGWCGAYFDVVSQVMTEQTQGKETRERAWLGTYFDKRKIQVVSTDKPDTIEECANGEWLVLEYKGKSYFVAGAGDLNPGAIKKTISDFIDLA